MPNQPGDQIAAHRYTVTYHRDDRDGDRTMVVLAANKQRAMDWVSGLMAMRGVAGAVLGAQYMETTTAVVVR